MDALELAQRIRNARPGTELRLPEGLIRGAFVVPRAVTLVGAGPGRTILDAGGRGAVLAVDAKGEQVVLRNLTIRGGRSRGGGGVSIDNGARVTLLDCRLEGNVAASGRGGAINIDRGRIELEGCELIGNRATEGGAVFVGGDAQASLRSCFLAQNSAERGGAFAFTGGARVSVVDTRLEENHAARKGHHLYTLGSSAQRPHVRLTNVVFGEVSAEGPRIVDESDFKAEFEIERTAWPEDSAKLSVKRTKRRPTLH